MRMGQDGLAFLKPEDNGGILNPDQSEIVATPPLTSNPSPEVDPEQTDYDVYDEVTEVKKQTKLN